MAHYQGEKFKKYLKDHSISVIAMAEKLDVSRNTVYQYYASDNLTREVVNNIITSLGIDESDIWPNHNTEQENLSRNIKEDPMQSELIAAQKRIIELMEENSRLKDEIRDLQGFSKSPNSIKAKPNA